MSDPMEGADPEAVALYVCNEAMKGLDARGAGRVAEYLHKRFVSGPVFDAAINQMTERLNEMQELERRLGLIGHRIDRPVVDSLPPKVRQQLHKAESEAASESH